MLLGQKRQGLPFRPQPTKAKSVGGVNGRIENSKLPLAADREEPAGDGGPKIGIDGAGTDWTLNRFSPALPVFSYVY